MENAGKLPTSRYTLTSRAFYQQRHRSKRDIPPGKRRANHRSSLQDDRCERPSDKRLARSLNRLLSIRNVKSATKGRQNLQHFTHANRLLPALELRNITLPGSRKSSQHFLRNALALANLANPRTDLSNCRQFHSIFHYRTVLYRSLSRLVNAFYSRSVLTSLRSSLPR